MKLSPAASLSLPSREEICRRYRADCQSRNGGNPPDIDAYVVDFPDPERSELRAELEAIQKGTMECPGKSDATIDSIPPEQRAGRDGATVDSYPAVQPAAVPKGSTESPGKDVGTLDEIRPAGPGTMDYTPSNPNLAADRAGPKPAQKDEQPYAIGSYDVISILGRGAMGVVYKAHQRGLKRTVALKMILSGGHASDLEVGRFRSEAAAVAQLQHPNIVQIYEVGESEGRPYFSLEFVDGTTLSQKIRDKPLPSEESARICKQIALGMDFAHKRGIIHRDLKPANILLTADGTPKISDFGLAKRLEEEDAGLTRTGTVLGTPSYMAPEQAEGKLDQLGPLSDVYSLGAILYDLLTGRAPFRGTTILETLEQVRTREPVPPLQLQPDVPPDLETICLKCLQKDPKRRYDSAGALAADLDRFLKGEPILARPIGRVERSWRWCKRNPWPTAAALLLVVGIATSTALAFGMKFERDEADRQAGIAQTNAAEAKRQEILAKENADDAKNKEVIAKANAIEADKQRKIADKNAEDAKLQESIARKQAIIARQNEDSAKETAKATINDMVDLGRKLSQRFQSKRVSAKAEPEMRAVRDELITTLRKAMKDVSKKIDLAAGTNFGEVGMYQMLGDLFLELGMSDEAAGMFQQAYEIVQRKADLNPTSDLARGNLGVMVQRLGEVPFKLQGDARTALKQYRKAREIHADVMAHPRDGFFKDADIKSILGHDEFNLGEAFLALGDPAQARKHYEASLELRQELSDDDPMKPTPRRYVLLARVPLGVASSYLADEKAMREHFKEAIELGDGLIKQVPKAAVLKRDMAEAHGAFGDALLRLGKADDAMKQYEEALKYMQIVVKLTPDDLAQIPLLALTYERLGLAADRLKKKPEAEQRFKDALQLRVELLRVEPNSLSRQAAYLLALARAGQYAEAGKAAAKVRAKMAQSTELQLQLARCFAVCAAGDPDPKSKYLDQAMEALQGATKDDYKNVVLLQTDPELAALRAHPAFGAVIAQLKTR